jgi:hypothetical protein
MNSDRKRTIIAGSLYFAGIIACIMPWGLSGTALTILASLLVMFNIINILTAFYLFLNLPLILLEIVLAIWFIAKGFDPDIMNNTKTGQTIGGN